MSDKTDAAVQRQDENKEDKEPLQVDIDKKQEPVVVNVDAVPLKSEENASVRSEKYTIINLDPKDLKSCYVVLCQKNCSICLYIALTVSAAVNVVLGILIIVAVCNKNNDSSNKSSVSALTQSQRSQFQEDYNRKSSVCVRCNYYSNTKLYRQAFSTVGSNELCCKEDAESLKILANLITTEKRREKTGEYIFLYISSRYKKDGTNKKMEDSTKSELKSKSFRLFAKSNKIIVEKGGHYVIFFAVTMTSIRHGNVSISIVRYREEEKQLLSVSLDTKTTELSYNNLLASEVFHLHEGDSVTIRIKGRENLYSYSKTNYFGMYRIG